MDSSSPPPGRLPAPPSLLPARPPSHLEELAAETRTFIQASKADATRRAYGSDWRDFSTWCGRQGLASLPASPATVAFYLTDLARDHKPATLQRRLTAIARAHEAAGHPSPATMRQAVVSETLKGIRRTYGIAQTVKRPLLTADLRRIVSGLPSDLQGARDRALLLVGFAGGFRRSELAALEVRDLAFTAEGVAVTLRRSKGDQEGQGREVALPVTGKKSFCPVLALKEWLRVAQIREGAVFRKVHGDWIGPSGLNANSVGRLVKRILGEVGYENLEAYGGHSLRAGFATQAAMNGATELEIMEQTGHRSSQVLRRYIRAGQLFRAAAARKVWL